MGDRVYESQAELAAAIRQVQESGALDEAIHAPAADPREEARRLTANAYVTTNDDTAARLLTEALALDAENPDALTFEIAINTAESLPRLQEIRDLARRRLGDEAFAEAAGRFWTAPHTREFMRAQHKLALTCFWTRQFDEATAELETLLTLDPRDTLMAREILLPLYLLARQREKAGALVARFPGHESALWSWAIFFYTALFGCDHERKAALADAHRVNRFVPDYLFGFTAQRQSLTGQFAVGSEEEANAAALVLTPVVNSDVEATTGWFANLIQQQTLS